MTINQSGQETVTTLPNEPAAEIKAPVLEAAAPSIVEKITPLDTVPRQRSEKALWILAFIAIVAALYLARAFLVPLLFGILVSYTLRPVWTGSNAIVFREHWGPRLCSERSSAAFPG